MGYFGKLNLGANNVTITAISNCNLHYYNLYYCTATMNSAITNCYQHYCNL